MRGQCDPVIPLDCNFAIDQGNSPQRDEAQPNGIASYPTGQTYNRAFRAASHENLQITRRSIDYLKVHWDSKFGQLGKQRTKIRTTSAIAVSSTAIR
jgi:hypothetical protein